MSRRKKEQRKKRDDSGQAMVEYALVVSLVMVGTTTTLFVFLPDFVNALQEYHDSYYIMLNLPIP